ncbi:hypothetical protein [Vibrio sp. S9_S30]|nr:hypothetical protein [Vibrio sp. S9_S30]
MNKIDPNTAAEQTQQGLHNALVRRKTAELDAKVDIEVLAIQR